MRRSLSRRAVLDIVLPGIDGFEVCRRLRRSSVVPVITVAMLMARRDDVDVAADCGAAYDSMVKPGDRGCGAIGQVGVPNGDRSAMRARKGVELEFTPMKLRLVASVILDRRLGRHARMGGFLADLARHPTPPDGDAPFTLPPRSTSTAQRHAPCLVR